MVVKQPDGLGPRSVESLENVCTSVCVCECVCVCVCVCVCHCPKLSISMSISVISFKQHDIHTKQKGSERGAGHWMKLVERLCKRCCPCLFVFVVFCVFRMYLHKLKRGLLQI
jgi:hypothetical protein